MQKNIKASIKYMPKSKNGITLIALVVTIVVLLILAGVTINLLFSDTGLFGKAQEAENAWRNGEQSDINAIQELSNQVNDILNGIYDEELDDTPTLAKGELVTGSNATYTDETGTAIIPVGFCVVKDSVENPSDTNTVASGLVISDVAQDDLDNSMHGNQFVWIPVNYDDFHLIEGYSNETLQTRLTQASNPSREAGASLTEILPGKPNTANSVLGTAESVAMYTSVQINGGFYIARFEAGIAGTTASTTTNDTNKQTQDGTVRPVSQKGVGVWNYIPWGGTSSNTASDRLPGDDNADGAVKVARSMYTKSSTCGVTSTLCYGVQWDATLNFIDSGYLTGNASGFVKNSTEMGNYSGTIAVTGSDTAYQQKHVYDLAGNVYEWTMEAYNTDSRVGRGGSYYSAGSGSPASYRNGDLTPDGSNHFIGLRVALYL